MKQCPNCRFENDSTMNFCLNCGTPLAANPSVAKTEVFPADRLSAPPIVSPKSNNRKYFWILGGLTSLLILVILGGLGAWYFVGNLKRNAADVKTPSPAVSPFRKSSPTPKKTAEIYSSNTTSNTTSESPEAEETVAPAPDFTPPTKPTEQGVFNVKANKNWQLSNLDVVPNEKFVLLATGSVNLRDVEKDVSPEGVDDKKHQSRRIFPEFPTGALLMRTRYADGKYSKISAVGAKKASGVWQNAPDERGRLEFCINDNATEGNDGEFIISLARLQS